MADVAVIVAGAGAGADAGDHPGDSVVRLDLRYAE